MFMGFKVEIYPNKEQEDYLLHCCHVYHDMWNFLVAKFKNNLPKIGKRGIIGYSDKDLRQEFVCENIPLRLYRSILMIYTQAVKRFYSKLSKPPKFHKYNPNKQSFYIVDVDYIIDENHQINIPKYLSNFTISKKISLSNLYLPDNINIISDVHYTHYKNKWYLSGCYKIDDVSINKDKEFLGLDWGIKNFYTDNNGKMYNYHKSVIREFQRIKRLQSIKDKKVKDSNNYNKIKLRLDKAYERMNNLKIDFIEQLTTKLCKEYHIVIENINIADFFKQKKKFISRNNMISPKFIFDNTLKWKCQKFGSYFIKVEPQYTSKTCNICGYILDDLKLRDRIFNCPCCGQSIDRDVNAAINIKNRGMETFL